MLEIEFRTFRAINEPETCEKFLEGHVKVLADYGITNITTNNSKWMTNPDVWGIIAVHTKTGQIVGGIRVHKANDIMPLPVEAAISNLDNSIIRYVGDLRIQNGVGELCALWNSNSVAGKGISLLLIRAGISIVNQLDMRHLLTICAEYTLPMVKRVGFEVETLLGSDGDFEYPSDKYIAHVLRKLNAVTIETAEDYDKDRILNLRNNPEQVAVEKPTKEELKINYKLIVPSYEKV